VNRKVVEGSLRVTTLPVAARLPEFRISMRELSSLQEGSMLTTGLSRNSDIEVLVGGTPRFRGRPARVGRRLAVNVTEVFGESESAEGQGPGLKLFDEGE
jgi:flagellar motor switch protein FliM